MAKIKYFVLAITLVIFIAGQISFSPSHAAQSSDYIFYEDNDPLIDYSDGDWQTVSDPNALGGQLTRSNVSGATITFRAQVVQDGEVSIRYTRAPDAGTYVIDWGYPGLSPSRYNANLSQNSYNSQVTLAHMNEGTYTITITNDSGAMFRLEAIRVRGILLPTCPSGLSDTTTSEVTTLSPTCQPAPVKACLGTSQSDIDAIATRLAITYNVTLTQDPINDGCWKLLKAQTIEEALNDQDRAIRNITNGQHSYTDFFSWEIKVYMSNSDNYPFLAYTCVADKLDCDSPVGGRGIWFWENGDAGWTRNSSSFGKSLVIHEFGHMLSDDWRRGSNSQGNAYLSYAFSDFFLPQDGEDYISNQNDDIFSPWAPFFDSGQPSYLATTNRAKWRIYGPRYENSIETLAEAYAAWVLGKYVTQNLQQISNFYCDTLGGSITLGEFVDAHKTFWQLVFNEQIVRGVSSGRQVETRYC